MPAIHNPIFFAYRGELRRFRAVKSPDHEIGSVVLHVVEIGGYVGESGGSCHILFHFIKH